MLGKQDIRIISKNTKISDGVLASSIGLVEDNIII